MKKIFLLGLILLNFKALAYERIVSIGGTLTEIIHELGSSDKIVGVDKTSVYPLEMKKLPQVGYHTQISIEGILTLKPDLVLLGSRSGNPPLEEQLKKMNIEVVKVEESDSFENARNKILQISKILKKEEKGKELISILDKDLAETSVLQEKIKSRRLLFIYARGANQVFAAGDKTPSDIMIKLAGSKNVFSTVEGFKPINSEALIVANPEAIIMLKGGIQSLSEGPWKIQGLEQTFAGKNKKLIEVDDLAFLGFGPRSGAELKNFMKKIQEI